MDDRLKKKASRNGEVLQKLGVDEMSMIVSE